jgi:hypothetical protein
MNSPTHNTPLPNERLAIPESGVRKRAALLFDRIYATSWQVKDYGIPPSITFNIPEVREFERTHKGGIIDLLLFSQKLKRAKQIQKKPESMLTKEDFRLIGSELILLYTTACYRLCGYCVTPVYERQEQYLSDYPVGNSVVYQAALENLPEIIEDDVSWEQILEFRNDKKAIRKYRELRLWLENSLSAQSVEHARDLIASKIENYEWAIRKHGLKTTTGALSSIFSWEGLIALGAGAGIGAAIGGVTWSALTGALFAVGRVSVWVAERMVEMQDIKHSPDAVVALICDAKRLMSKTTHNQ